MHRDRYVVIQEGDGWFVVNDGRVSGMFASQETAAAFAKLRAAHEARGPSDDQPNITFLQP